METALPDLRLLRERFPALSRTQDGRPCVFADAPGGTQVPREVIGAMARYLERSNANEGGAFATSRETGDVIREARRAAADLLGARPHEVVFGPNTTTLALALSRAVARDLGPGDEVVVTLLDHDANVSPWVLAARDRGAAVRWVDLRPDDCTLDLDSLDRAIGPRTRVVAFTLASNAVGTLTPAREIVARAHARGAAAVADGVHLAPHRLIDVAALGADVLFCSAYKFFGPHVGVMFARGEALRRWRPYQVRPAPDEPPGSWETGTLSHEALAGLVGTVEYLAWVGREARPGGDTRGRPAEIEAAMQAIGVHEAVLTRRFLEGAAGIPGLRIFGISDPRRADQRVPTFAVRLGDASPRALAEELGRRGVFVWDGNYYAIGLMERLGLEETGGAVRVGFCHYNTPEEVDRVLEELADLAGRGAGERAAVRVRP